MNQTSNTSRIPQILRLHQVTKAIGLSRASIYRLMARGLFPRSIKLGISSVGWPLEEIEFWIFERKLATMH